MQHKNQAFLLLGTNLGNKKENLSKAIVLLKKAGLIISRVSSIYETAAWGKTDQNDFLNQVIEIHTDRNPAELLETVLETEIALGRIRKEKWGTRIIDIDILLFDNDIVNTENLAIPHPALHERMFTLLPLSELAAGLIHPLLNKSIAVLLKECTDALAVKKLN